MLVLPLPAHNEGEPLTQLLCLGGFPGVSEADVRNCATTCGLDVAAVELRSVNALNETHLVMLAERLLSRYLGTQGYVRVFDDVFARHSDLFPPPPPPSTAAAEPRWNEEEGDSGGVIDFVEAAKVMVSINMRATIEPWSPGGRLGLTLFLEPMVFKRVHPPFAYLQHLSLQQQQQSKTGRKQQQQQQKLVDDAPDEEGLCGAGGVFPPGEAVLEMRVVKFLPDLTNLGLLATLPSPVMELTPLEKANARRGFDLESPKDEERYYPDPSLSSLPPSLPPSLPSENHYACLGLVELMPFPPSLPLPNSMRNFWRLAHSLLLPPHPLEYVRVFFKGQGSTSISYPAACLASQFAHNYSRTTQAYPRLISTFLQLLITLPGVTKAFSTASSSPSSSSSSSSSLMPVGKRLTSPEKLGPGELKTARQLRDEEQEGSGGEEGEMIDLLVGGAAGAQAGGGAGAAAAAAGSKVVQPPSSSSSSSISSSSSRKPPKAKKAIPSQKKESSGPPRLPPPLASSTTSLASSSLARQQQDQEEADGTGSSDNNNNYEEEDDLFSDDLTGTSTGLSASSSSSSVKKSMMPPPLPPSHPAPPPAADTPADKPKKKTAKKKAVVAKKLTQVLGGGDGATTTAAGTPMKKKTTTTTKKKQVDGGGEMKAAAKKVKT